MPKTLRNGSPVLGLTLREERKKKGLTQSDVAKAIGVSKQSVVAWEKNQKYPTKSRLEALCKFYGIEQKEILNIKKESVIGEINIDHAYSNWRLCVFPIPIHFLIIYSEKEGMYYARNPLYEISVCGRSYPELFEMLNHLLVGYSDDKEAFKEINNHVI